MEFVDLNQIKKDLRKMIPWPVRWGRNLYKIGKSVSKHRNSWGKLLSLATGAAAGLMERYLKGGRSDRTDEYVQGENADEINAAIRGIYADSQSTGPERT